VSGALDGLRVLDAATRFWGALGSALLADFGASVVKLECLPEARELRRRRLAEAREEGAPWDYEAALADRNKRSLAVDPSREEGREILRALAARCDVVATDRPLAELEGLGLDYASLEKRAPGLIYARASGFGPQGPDRELPPLDELAAARTGMMPILPQPGQPPVYTGAGPMYTAVMLAVGVALALQHRARSGEGQEVDVSLLAGNMYAASLDLQAFLAMGGQRFLEPVSRLDAGNPMSGTLYPTRDGLWVTLTMPDTDRWWPAFAEIVGLDPADPRFDSHEKRCEANRLELIRVREQAFAREPAAHWRQLFAERQLSADVIEEYAYPSEDPQARRNRYILELEHPAAGAVKSLGFPIFMSESPAHLERLAPCLGQHTAQILREELGYSEERIQALAETGVIA